MVWVSGVDTTPTKGMGIHCTRIMMNTLGFTYTCSFLISKLFLSILELEDTCVIYK